MKKVWPPPVAWKYLSLGGEAGQRGASTAYSTSSLVVAPPQVHLAPGLAPASQSDRGQTALERSRGSPGSTPPGRPRGQKLTGD